MGAVPFQEAKCAWREPGDVADLDEQPGGAGWAHPVQVGQGGAGPGEQRGEFFVRVFLALTASFQVADQLGGDPAFQLPEPPRTRALRRARPSRHRRSPVNDALEPGGGKF